MITLPTAAGATTEYEDFYESTLAAPITAADTDIYPTVLPASAVGFLVLDPLGTNPEIIYYNFKGASFVRTPSAVDGEGRGVGNTTPRPYEQGTKIGMYSIAEFFEGLATGRFMRDGFLQSRHFSSSIDPNSWIGTGETWNYVDNLGEKVFRYVTAGDKRTKYALGTKVRMPRTVTMPTMNMDLTAASTQFARKTTPSGMTQTDDITVAAKVRLKPSATDQVIASKNDGTSGWLLFLDTYGRVVLSGYNGAGNWRRVTSVESVPFGRTVTIAGTLDMSGFTSATNKIFIDGGEIFSFVGAGGTSPASFSNVGNFEIGASAGALPFSGSVQDVELWSVVRTPAQILDTMHKPLVGNEAGLVGYWPLNGNFNDLTANANHLTGFGGAVATNPVSFYAPVEYGIIIGMSFAAGNTTISVFTGTDHVAPYENMTGISYSAARSPVGFPGERSKWIRETSLRVSGNSVPGLNNWSNINGAQIIAPIGTWLQTYKVEMLSSGGVGNHAVLSTLSTSATTESDIYTGTMANGSNVTQIGGTYMIPEVPITITAGRTPLYLNTRYTVGGPTLYQQGFETPTVMRLQCPYV